MLFPEPQLGENPVPVGPPKVSAGDAFSSGLQEGFQHTSPYDLISLIGGGEPTYIKDAENSDFSQPMTQEDYKNSPLYRPGGWEPGMTPLQAQAKAAKMDDIQSKYEAEHGPGWAHAAGYLVGGSLDPLYYIPFLDVFAPALKAGLLARTGDLVGHAFLQATNGALAAAAEQPVAYAEAAAHNKSYDIGDAFRQIGTAALAGGLFGGLGRVLKLPFGKVVDGTAKAIEDEGALRDVDTQGVVKPDLDQVFDENGKPVVVDYTPTGPTKPPEDDFGVEGLPEPTEEEQADLDEAEEQSNRLNAFAKALRVGAACYGNR